MEYCFLVYLDKRKKKGNMSVEHRKMNRQEESKLYRIKKSYIGFMNFVSAQSQEEKAFKQH